MCPVARIHLRYAVDHTSQGEKEADEIVSPCLSLHAV